MLDIVEMGIARDIDFDNDSVTVRITPTYSGCPAMNAIEIEIRSTLTEHGFNDIKVKKDFSEIWTTEWMTSEARQKLSAYGIAPPGPVTGKELKDRVVKCPYCDSEHTELQAEFGATACKAQYFCKDCHQPFEYFKCH